jgi:hypothetical protein
MILLLKVLLFTVVVPGAVSGYVPLLLARGAAPVSGVLGAAAEYCARVGRWLPRSARGAADRTRRTGPAP